MRTSISALAFAAAIATPAPAQQSTTPSQQQIQPNKQMQEEADKGIKTRDSGKSGFVSEQRRPGSSAFSPGQPNRSSQTTGSATSGGRSSQTGSPR